MLEIYYGHRVVTMDPSHIFGPDTGNVTTPSALERVLSERQDWTPVSLADLRSRGAEIVQGDRPHFVLTFDDGYLDNRTTLLPILERYGVPAAVFITTGFVSGQLEPYEYELAHLILERDTLNQLDGGAVATPLMEAKANHYELLRRKLWKMGPNRRARTLATLVSLNTDPPLPPEPRYLLNWDEVIELHQHPLVTIGAHAHTHPMLSKISPRTVLAELRTCRTLLETNLGVQIDTLAYPYGANNALVRVLVRLAGFTMAFSTEERAVRMADLRRPLALPRFDLNRR